MTERDIYLQLVAGGLSPVGACAVMGNMFAESAMRSNNVEDRAPLGDADYTFNVDNGLIPAKDFVHDKYGYGYCQWTYHTRKQALYDFAESRGASIGDGAMQVAFCLAELSGDTPYHDYIPVGNYLATATDLYEAVALVCKKYEQPAVNNIDDRYGPAVDYYAKYVDPPTGPMTQVPQQEPEQHEPQPTEHCTVPVRILRKGDLGRDVYALQCAMDDMGYKCGKPDGDFGTNTENAVNFLKLSYGLEQDGVADADVWQILLQKV